MLARNPDLDMLEPVVRAAGDMARRYVAGENRYHRKADGSPVSEADLAVNAYLCEQLRAARPDYGWLSEEDQDNPARLSAKRVFIVDPIDGTSALIARQPEFTISIGIVENHRPIAGVVYNPLTEEYFCAAKGCGAYLNGQPIHVSDRAELVGARVLIRTDNIPKRSRALWPDMVTEERCSAAYRLTLAAAGIFDAAICLTSKREWDLAAAEIIVCEAGGEVVTGDGALPHYNDKDVIIPSALASSPVLIKQILTHTMRA